MSKGQNLATLEKTTLDSEAALHMVVQGKPKPLAAFQAVADTHGVSPQVVCLAWELAKSPVVIPIPRSSKASTRTPATSLRKPSPNRKIARGNPSTPPANRENRDTSRTREPAHREDQSLDFD